MDLLFGLDIGTTNIKAVAIDLSGALVAQASRRTPSYFPAEGQEEHNPQHLWETVCEVLHELMACQPAGAQPLALATASLAEAGVPVSAAGEVLYPFICWHDKRTRPQWQWWEENVGPWEVYQRTGLLLHPMYSVMKLMWLAQNHPEVIANTTSFLCMEDYAIWQLTGMQATSFAMASRTMALNLTTRSWDEKILSLAGLPDDIFPPLHASGVKVGEVTAQAAQQTGLPQGLPIATGGHDHLCAALAAGALDPTTALDSSGTTETMIVSVPTPCLTHQMMTAGYGQGCHVLTDKFAINSGVPTGGAALEWLAEILKLSVPELLAEAQTAPVGAGDVYFVPYLRGSGTPHRDPNAQALFYGLTDTAGRAHLARAALEGICFEIALNFDYLRELANVNLTSLRVVGGGSRSDFWNQLKADITGLPVEVPRVGEATACGAALLGGLAVGALSGWQEISRLVPIERTYKPDAAKHSDYQARLENVYRHLYPALRHIREKA
jgi:xylulokinase